MRFRALLGAGVLMSTSLVVGLPQLTANAAVTCLSLGKAPVHEDVEFAVSVARHQVGCVAGKGHTMPVGRNGRMHAVVVGFLPGIVHAHKPCFP